MAGGSELKDRSVGLNGAEFNTRGVGGVVEWCWGVETVLFVGLEKEHGEFIQFV